MTGAGHLALLGDSIFDNVAYVGSDKSVVEQVRDELTGWTVTLLAVDGASSKDVHAQLARLDGTETHLVVSVGGNDALNASGILSWPVATVAEAAAVIAEAQSQFRGDYEPMASAVLARGVPSVFCTVYDSIPGLGQAAKTALSAFNDVILRLNRFPVIDLRLVCTAAPDYSNVSPIEPSALGGAKIARTIGAIAQAHDFTIRRSVIFP